MEPAEMRLIVTAFDSLSACVTKLTTLVDRSLSQHDAELMEIREGLAELDGAKAPRRALDALHTRIDELEGWLVEADLANNLNPRRVLKVEGGYAAHTRIDEMEGKR